MMASFQFFQDGNADQPVLVLANSLCASHDMWEPQLDAWRAHFRVLRFNYAGHGSHALPEAFTQAQPLVGFLLDALDGLG
ncbi:MAG: 3-oxoadipate enol-lactonase, partial [Comamonadaceae bacterium]